MKEGKAEVLGMQVDEFGNLHIKCKSHEDAVKFAWVMESLAATGVKIEIKNNRVVCHLYLRPEMRSKLAHAFETALDIPQPPWG
jgi:hypothetical protein